MNKPKKMYFMFMFYVCDELSNYFINFVVKVSQSTPRCNLPDVIQGYRIV